MRAIYRYSDGNPMKVATTLGPFATAEYKGETIVAVPSGMARGLWLLNSAADGCIELCPLHRTSDCTLNNLRLEGGPQGYKYACLSSAKYGSIVWVPLHKVVAARLEGKIHVTS